MNIVIGGLCIVLWKKDISKLPTEYDNLYSFWPHCLITLHGHIFCKYRNLEMSSKRSFWVGLDNDLIKEDYFVVLIEKHTVEYPLVRPPLLHEKNGLSNGLSSGVETNTFMFRFTMWSGLSRGGGLSSEWPLKRGSIVSINKTLKLLSPEMPMKNVWELKGLNFSNLIREHWTYKT